MKAIEVTGLSKDYPYGFWRRRWHRGLDDVSFAVEEGEIFGLLGPNGAGKTTTLKILLRLIYPTAGSACLLGRPIEDVDVHSHVGYLPEAPYFYDYLTAREFLDYCGQLFGYDKPTRRQRINALLEQVALTEAADVALRHFSRGMLQRVGIAQALINDPELVFLDEPMQGLDPIGRREVRDLIRALHAGGKTVCFCSHVLADVEALCARVAILNRGRLHGLGALEEILQLQVKVHEVLIAQPSAALTNSLAAISDGVCRTGEKVTLTVPDGELFKVIDCVRQHGGRLVTVQPVRVSLEDYFFEHFGTEKVPEFADRF
ncbi:MAG: ABC transporter ATP-binding protein [Terriglobia bacterium]